MTKMLGPYHYEFIAGRPIGHQWRVADQEDDVVQDFPTEAQAREYVRVHNESIKCLNPEWRQ